MAHFMKPPGTLTAAQQSAYDVDNKLAPGSVWRVRVQLGSTLYVALWGGKGLWLKSGDPKVVPLLSSSLEKVIGDFRIIPLFGLSPGISMFETGAGSSTWVTLQVEVVKRKVPPIVLQPPHMVVNGAPDGYFPLAHPYRLQYSEVIPDKSMNGPPAPTAQDIINKVKARLPLQHLVFNGHGSRGEMELGAGITKQDIPLFSQLAGQVKVIWIRNCSFAGGEAWEGPKAVADVALNAGAYVVAPVMCIPQYKNLPKSTIEYPQGTHTVKQPGGLDFSWASLCVISGSVGFSIP